MKILLLNPYIDAQHQLTQALQQKQIAVLTPADAKEALQMLKLHGTSVELAVVHRETAGPNTEAGLELVAALKQDPAQADLPLIVTSSVWSDAEFAAHQSTPNGAHAYMRFPFDARQLLTMIDAVLGTSVAAGMAANPNDSSLMLEEASQMYAKPPTPDNQFELDSPMALAPPRPLPDLSPAAVVEDVSIPTAASTQALDMDAVDLSRLDLPTTSGESESEFMGGDGDAAAPTIEPSMQMPAPTSVGFEPQFSLAPDPEPPAGLGGASLNDAQVEEEIAHEMPYLFNNANTPKSAPMPMGMGFSQPLGDAVVPGGAANSPDTETLKKYLLLREQDVGALSSQLRSAKEQITGIEDQLRQERAKNVELSHTVDEQKRKIDDSEKDKAIAQEALQSEMNELRFQMKAKTDKARVLEARVREATEEMERLKERVRSDIRKIRVREKELENRLEIMRKDSEALISARENKIVELKRKLDLLEFNMDLLQDQYGREKDSAGQLRDRLARAAQVVRVAGGLLDSNAPAGSGSDDVETDGSTGGGDAAAS